VCVFVFASVFFYVMSAMGAKVFATNRVYRWFFVCSVDQVT